MSESDKSTETKKGKFDEDGSMNNELRDQLHEIRESLRKIDGRGEKIESAIFDIQIENEKLKQQIHTLLKERNEWKEEAERTKTNLRKMRKQLNHTEQWGRKWNLRIWGLQDGKEETAEETIAKVVSFIRFELGLADFQAEQIDIAHRLGRFKHGDRRPVIARFLRLIDRNAVLRVKHQLKGKKFGIAEDLTSANYKLLQVVREKAGKGNAWTRDGVIHARLHSGSVVRIDEDTPLSDYFGDHPQARENYYQRHSMKLQTERQGQRPPKKDTRQTAGAQTENKVGAAEKRASSRPASRSEVGRNQGSEGTDSNNADSRKPASSHQGLQTRRNSDTETPSLLVDQVVCRLVETHPDIFGSAMACSSPLSLVGDVVPASKGAENP